MQHIAKYCHTLQHIAKYLNIKNILKHNDKYLWSRGRTRNDDSHNHKHTPLMCNTNESCSGECVPLSVTTCKHEPHQWHQCLSMCVILFSEASSFQFMFNLRHRLSLIHRSRKPSACPSSDLSIGGSSNACTSVSSALAAVFYFGGSFNAMNLSPNLSLGISLMFSKNQNLSRSTSLHIVTQIH